MPQLDHSGPDGQGPKTGRQLGRCEESNPEKQKSELGKGQGLKRKSGGGKGKGRRLKSSQ